MCRRAAATTSGGRSSNRKPATNSAICWDAVPMDECYPAARICSPRLGERNRVRIGIAIGGPLDRIGAVARRCEEAGFDSLWIAEAGRTAFVQAAVAAQATKTIRIGTSIALAFPRSPVITAMAARDLSELSNGRFTLGLGTQVKRVNEYRFSTTFEHPAPKMAEIVDVCREMWDAFAGKPIDHRGRFYTVTMGPLFDAGPPPGPIPIYLAAVNERMLRLIGTKADGFLGHPFTSPSYVKNVARAHISEGIKAAGRSDANVEIAQSVICSVADDDEAARAGAKPQIAFYGTTRTYKPVLDHHGFGDAIEQLRAAHAKNDMEGMVSAVTDEMAETYAVTGTAEEARAKLQRYEGIVDTVILNPPWIWSGTSRSDAYDRLIETFAPNR
ncbi:MAG: TIGR03617 family F420-dependent LLM class oxidoreductase [Actinobacteria bacterium]|nr:MAG: TIGR03617 family F420-dependent LLM class oxidoreductase [Actinomycetota bacterium]